MSLKKQAIHSVFWTLGDTFLLSGLSLLASLVLARLLGPVEFGLIGMIAVFIAIGITLVDSGMTASLIRSKNADNDDYSTVFFLNLGISGLVYLIVFFTAPLIASFFNQEILINILRLYSISFIITAFSAVQLAILNKKMQFKKIMMLNIPGTVIGVVVGVVLGYMGFGVWSIVWMYLTNQIIKSVVLWLNSSWKPQLKYSVQKAKEHYNFGYKLMISGLIDTIFKNIYNVVIGKFYAVQTLGYYERARAFNDYPIAAMTGVIGRVTYPLMAKIQDDKQKVTAVYKQILQFTFFVSAPLMFGASAVAEPLFMLVLGEEWLPAVPYFQILCLAGMLYPIHAFNINILKVYGRSDLFLKLEIIKKIVITISILITFQFGVMGLVWSSVFTSFIALFINMHYSAEMINYKTIRQLSDMLPTLLISGVMFLAMYWTVNLKEIESYLLKVVVSSLVGGVFYIGINHILKRDSYLFITKLVKERKL